ncbi:hypothetical protein [Methyloglobulus sp.]|uniref:hypothetical protein n=1 Tax=Methyloglobulus sp. TaxID=2518622 RepID=UPI0032B84EE2
MTPYVDLPMDLADASLELLAGELGHGGRFHRQTRFSYLPLENHQPFTNLLEGVA